MTVESHVCWVRTLSVSSGAVYGHGTNEMPWWTKKGMVVRAVVSWPPCCEAVELKTPANLPTAKTVSVSKRYTLTRFKKAVTYREHR